MSKNFTKVVIITGGSSGIGLDIAKRFLQNNWQVIVTGRKKNINFPNNLNFNFYNARFHLLIS